MQITLTDTDAQMLREFLHDHVPELQREIAHTDVKVFRHVLIERQEAIERLLRQLEQVEAERPRG